VYPAGDFGFAPIPFRLTKSIPLPKIPDVTIERTEGSPLRTFTVFLKVKNINAFPLNIKSINSYIELNGTKYSLLRTQESTEIKPGSAETVSLKMEMSTGKTLGLALNAALSSTPQFTIGGDISCQTPYGLVYVPLKLNSEKK
jgi:LEA14-like dessication related protein